jgi:hypothetical protein
MMLRFRLFIFALFIIGGYASACWGRDCSEENLMNDLLIVDYWNRKLDDKMPVTYNHLLQGGYFTMPSARMGEDGEIGIGYSHVPPYRNYNLRVQILSHLELTGNYRVFHGIKDPILSPLGFGDFSDKGANFKFAILKPEDSSYQLPGLAIGLEDFIGTSAFYAQYIVLTHVFLEQNLEVSLGYGSKRFRGFFGGVNFMPFLKCCSLPYLQNLSFTAEYDATPYKSKRIEPHPKGRVKKSSINFGIKYRLWNFFDFSAAYIRGKEYAFSASAFYNFGTTTGFLPKIDNPLPYTTPINIEPLGQQRPEQALVSELVFAFREQNLELRDIYLYYDDCLQKTLRLTILNETYWQEKEVRCRLNDLLGPLIPIDIDEVIVVIDSEGFPIQEYHFHMNYVRQFMTDEIGPMELNILTPMTEVTWPNPYTSSHLFSRHRGLYNLEVFPKTHTIFGSSTGKFKYTLGVHIAFNGFLPRDIYYNILLGYTFYTSLHNAQDFDRLNPSQLINVRTDVINYYKDKGLTLDEAFLQKNWNLGCGFYARIAGGYFEEEYGGLATGLLYYPVDSPWAIGIESAVLKKRNYRGLGFTNKIRKLHGFTPTYRHFLGSQYFINFYYDWKYAEIAFRVSGGKFLANDWGVRGEVTRYFPSGMTLSVWYTWTNGKDRINGKTYYDKGVMISMPFDIFYTYSQRSRWNYGMSAWLRDVGVEATTGLHLYELINEQRQY